MYAQMAASMIQDRQQRRKTMDEILAMFPSRVNIMHLFRAQKPSLRLSFHPRFYHLHDILMLPQSYIFPASETEQLLVYLFDVENSTLPKILPSEPGDAFIPFVKKALSEAFSQQERFLVGLAARFYALELVEDGVTIEEVAHILQKIASAEKQYDTLSQRARQNIVDEFHDQVCENYALNTLYPILRASGHGDTLMDEICDWCGC